ncbi:hypothetical protein SEA_ECLIPTUS_39 [Gordonia phage Ecliptus]|nr:hypothetical protein SEA_ECLIPTUS_39 [Gordonia phage Ecliptus]
MRRATPHDRSRHHRSREPIARLLRPTPMLYDILAIIALVAVGWWLIATAPDLR